VSAAIKRKPGRPPVPGLVERRREEILDAAAKLFAERTYADTDTQLLADRLGVGKGTIYRYFPTKETLFLAAVDRAMRRLSAQVQSDVAPTVDPLDRITRAIRSYLRFFEENPNLVELLIQERAQFRDRKKPTYFAHRDANVGPWKELFERLMAAGRVRRMPVRRILDTLSDVLYGTIFTNYFAGRKRSFEVQTEDVVDVFFGGILSDREHAHRKARDWEP
jgi:AcrR family transcriptional regulator